MYFLITLCHAVLFLCIHCDLLLWSHNPWFSRLFEVWLQVCCFMCAFVSSRHGWLLIHWSGDYIKIQPLLVMNFVSSSSVIFVLLRCKQCLKKLIFPFYKLCSLFRFSLNVFIYQKEEIRNFKPTEGIWGQECNGKCLTYPILTLF